MGESVKGKTALVAGATGLVGGDLVKLLLADEAYAEVVALVRKPAALLAGGKLTQVVTDWSDEHVTEVMREKGRGADVFCALGTTMKQAGTKERFRKVDFDYPLLLGRLAERYGASAYVIVTAVGSDPRSVFFYSRVKGELEAELQRLSIPALHIFRPSLLLGNRSEVRPGEKLGERLSGLFASAMIGSWRKYRPIQAETVARGMAAAVKQRGGGVAKYEYEQITALSGRG